MQADPSLVICDLRKITQVQNTTDQKTILQLSSNQSEKTEHICSQRNRLDRLKFKRPSITQVKKKQTQTFQQSTQTKQDAEICLLHSAPADLICITDGQQVCAKCALFGSHKGHDVSNIDGISAKMTDLVEQIFPFYQELKQIEIMCIGEKFRKQWIQKIKEKQESMTKQVSSTVRQIIKQLSAIEKQKNQQIKQYFENQIKLVQQYSKMPQQSNLKLWFQEVQNLPNIIEQIVSQCKIENMQLKYLNETKRGDQLFDQSQSLKKKIQSTYQKNVQSLSASLSFLKLTVQDQFESFLPNIFHLRKGQHLTPFGSQKQDSIHKRQLKVYPPSNKSIQRKERSALQNSNLQSSPINKRFDDDCMLLSVGVQSSFPKSFSSNSFNHNLSIQQGENYLPHLEISNIKMVEQSYTDNTKSEQERVIFRNIQNASTVQLNECYKRKKKLQVPEKYKGIVDDLKNDRADQVDLGGAQLGDSNILFLCQYIRKSKRLRVLKLIRNKISDDAVGQILKACGESKVSSLNLSQNFLTDRAVYIIEQQKLQKIRNITLSLNKINRRNVKTSIQNLSKKGVTLSI